MIEQNKKDTIIRFVKFIDSCYDITITISYASYDEVEEKMIVDVDIFGIISHLGIYTPKNEDINFNFIYKIIVDYVDKNILENYKK